MIQRAYVVAGPSAGPDSFIGGMSIRARQALSLRDAGLDVTEIGTADEPAAADQAAIVACAGCVWHPAVVKRLARSPIQPDGLIAIGTSDAAVYLCGRNRVRSTIATLRAGEPAQIEAIPVALQPPEFIVRPRTGADRRAATTLLLRSLDKPTDGLASRYLHRPISRQVTRLVLPWGVTPNAMTIFAALFGVAGVWIAIRGGYWNILAGAALFWIQNILDGCDGEIARLKYLRSRRGEWLDQIVDDALNIAFLGAVGLALARGGHRFAWWLTVVAGVAQAVHLVGLYAGLLLRAGGRGSVAVLRWWVGDPTEDRTLGDLARRDVLSFAYFVSALLNVVVVVFVWHTALTVGSAVVTTLQWIVWGGPGVQIDGDGGADRAGEATA